MLAAAVLVMITGGGLWASGIVAIPGVPVPRAVQSILGGILASGERVVQIDAVEPELEPEPEAVSAAIESHSVERRPQPSRSEPAAEPRSADKEQEPVTEPQPDPEPARRAKANKKQKRKAKGTRPSETQPQSQPQPPKSTPESPRKSKPAAESESTPAPPPPPPPPRRPTTPAGADLHYKQGNLYLKEKKVALAIEEFKKCLSVNPHHGLAYRSLGVAYMLLGRERSAIQAYEKFVEASPGHRDAPKVKQIIADYYSRNPK
jgi:predicted Zn-dependent protease